MIAEDFPVLERERQDLLTLILPICDEGVFRPVDLFPGDEPTILRRTFSRADRSWTVVALLNWDDGEKREGVPLGELAGLPAGDDRYHVYDVFARSFLGILTPGDFIDGAPAHGVRLPRVTPAVDRPQIVGTTTHISQGAVETTTESWDAATGRLTIGFADLDKGFRPFAEPASDNQRRIGACDRVRPPRLAMQRGWQSVGGGKASPSAGLRLSSVPQGVQWTMGMSFIVTSPGGAATTRGIALRVMAMVPTSPWVPPITRIVRSGVPVITTSSYDSAAPR